MAERRPRKFIAKAIKRPGALRAKAKRAGLIEGEEKLSSADLTKLAERGGTRTKRQVALARTLKRLSARRSPEPAINVTNTDPVAFGSPGISGQTGATIAEARGRKIRDRDKEGMIRSGMAIRTSNRSGHTDGGT